jgi:hypothetical protein
VTRIVSVDSDSDTIVIERPLPWDLFPNQLPHSVHSWEPELTNVGIEGLTFEFRTGRYAGHLREEGYNAISLRQVANSWVRDIQTVNAGSFHAITISLEMS